MSQLTRGISQRNKRTLIIDGHDFTKKQTTKTTEHWRCARYSSHKCRMLAVTAGDELVSTKNEHSHDVRPGKIEANQIMHQMKKEARQQIVPVSSSIIATCLQEVTDEKAVQLSLPSRAAINRTLNRQKQNFVPSMPIIKDRHFIIPMEYFDFCLFDSGVMDPERILIFGDRDNVHALRVHNSLWLCDGTFKICPMQFYQLYTIHIQIGGFYPPCLYALLPNKTEQTYSKFLKAITSVSDNAQPSRILLDFERAAVNAFTSAFPESSIKGCYFHLCQAFLRKINELGLKNAYENNCELSLALRLIPALSFVPTDLVEQSFESVIEEIEHVVDRLDLEQSLSDKIDELASYFQRSYIKGEKAGNRYSL